MSGLEELRESRDDTVKPQQVKLQKLKELIEEESLKIQRLVLELANYNDAIVLDTIRREIHQSTKYREVLETEKLSIEKELSEIELTEDKEELIMDFASEIATKLTSASFENKRRILDLLDVQVVIFWDVKPRRIKVSCALRGEDTEIELHPSRVKCRSL